MNLKNKLVFTSLFCVLSATACSGDDSSTPANTAGSSGNGGSNSGGSAQGGSGQSGSQNNGGSGGSAQAGSGGSNAGSSGSSGSSATGGSAGSNGGSAGTGNSGAGGNAGTAGNSGSSGTSGSSGNAGNAGNAGVAGSGGSSGNSAYWVMGYYPGYQQNDMPADEIPFDRMTHIAVGAILPNADGSLNTDFYLGGGGPAFAQDLAQRAHQANRKAILMLGGAGAHDGFVSAASAANRAAFVANLVAFAQQNSFDGIDLDWEPLPVEELSDFDALAKALRVAWPDMILTVPVGGINVNYETVDAQWAAISASFDQINLMTYSMAGSYDGWQSWHHSPLDGEGPTTPTSISSSIDAWIAAGVPTSKLGIGAGFYGLCYTAPVTAPKQALNGSQAYADDNVLTYRDIVADYLPAGTRTYDNEASTPYLTFANGMGPYSCTYLSYTDEESLAAQAQYIKTKGLGGGIIWTINEGHLPAGAADQDPLMTALYSGLNQ